MYEVTKGELIFILDTVEEVQELLSSTHIEGTEELQEVTVIINGLLDHGEQEKDND